jgi:uncharacterized membrane protein
MKRTILLRRCTWISVAAAFALAWVNYWVALAAFVCTGIFAVAWLVSDYADYANEQERMKQYHERLKAR